MNVKLVLAIVLSAVLASCFPVSVKDGSHQLDIECGHKFVVMVCPDDEVTCKVVTRAMTPGDVPQTYDVNDFHRDIQGSFTGRKRPWGSIKECK